MDMFGESMRDDIEYIDYIERVLKKTIEDLVESYFRTPPYISSKKYIYRALRRLQYAYNYTTIYKRSTKNLKEGIE